MKYTCEQCGGTFMSERSQSDAAIEAEELWGVKDAPNDPGMAIICDECFKALMADVVSELS